jgi:hypothetical protein
LRVSIVKDPCWKDCLVSGCILYAPVLTRTSWLQWIVDG